MSTAQAAIIPIAPALELKKILYATDFSEASLAALPIAAALARRFDATLCVAHIWSALPARMASTVAAISAYDQLQDAACQRMQGLLRDQRLQSLKCVPLVVEGDAKDRVTPMIANEDIDLIVVGTQGRSGLKKLFLGSVAEAICRTATRPVLTVGPNAVEKFKTRQSVKNTLCPTDLSGHSTGILPTAASIAAEFGAAIRLLHVLPPAVQSKDIAANIVRKLEREMQELCRQQISPRCESRGEVRFGEPIENHSGNSRE